MHAQCLFLRCTKLSALAMLLLLLPLLAHAAALAEENALAATLQVAAAYDELMLAHKKEVHCNIITAEVGSWHNRRSTAAVGQSYCILAAVPVVALCVMAAA